MTNEVSLSKATIDDLKALQDFCKAIYATYFGDHWEGPGLELYLEEQFGTEVLKKDLRDETIDYFIIRYDAQLIGFLKINYEAAFEDFDGETVCELEKMYVLPECKGKGIGKIALNSAIEAIRRKGTQTLFLCVLDSNEGAISFYEKVGFKLHSKIRLKYQYFKEALKGLDRMYLELTCE